MSTDSDEPVAAASTVQSVDRAMQILEMIAASGSAGVTDLAADLGVHKSTVSRLVAALEARAFVEQVSERGKYRLGVAVSRLARSRHGHLDLGALGQRACDTLAAEIGETANVAVLDRDRIVNIVERISAAEIALQTWVGQTCPAHATSSGKALLAGLAPEDVRRRLGPRPADYTEHTIVDFDALNDVLADIRLAGWASAREELEVGLNAVAAPVRDHLGEVVAALSVSGPAYRLTPERFAPVAARVVAVAADLSSGLGWEPAARV